MKKKYDVMCGGSFPTFVKRFTGIEKAMEYIAKKEHPETFYVLEIWVR